jgi:predicted PurR-regulated permease PerM
MQQAAKPPLRPRPSRQTAFEARDPRPVDPASFWRGVAQAATIVMALLAFGLFLYVARSVVLPVLCAIVVGMTLGPTVDFAERRGVPAWLSALAVVVIVIGAINVAAVTLAGPTADLVKRAPEIAAAVKTKLHIFDSPIEAFHRLQVSLGLVNADTPLEMNLSGMISGVLTGIVTVLTPAAVQFVVELILFFGTLFFVIAGRANFRKYTASWFASREARLRALKIFRDIEGGLSGYLVVVSAINVALGILTALAAWLMGLPGPLLWGALAFGLNYVPYVGPGIMYVLLFTIGLLTFPTLIGALLPPAVFMAMTLVEGQFITPTIVGRRVLQVHPLAIFLGIAFWAWLWGPIGAFLATPLLIIARVALGHLYPAHTTDLPG